MNIVFIGTILPPSLESKLLNENIPLDIAALTLQDALLKGFKENRQNIISTISIPSIFSNRILWEKGHVYQSDYSSVNISIPVINILGLKQLLAPFFAKKYLQKIPYDVKVDVIYLYTITSQSLKIAKKIRKVNPNAKVILHVADLPQFIGPSTYIRRCLKSIEAYIVSKFINIVDGYVLLSKYMIDKLPHKPYLVMEGIYGTQLEKKTPQESVDNPLKKILYTGTLLECYGIYNLIDALALLPDKNYRLLLCGRADNVSELKSKIASDSRIEYLGVLPRNEIIHLQQEADLLVNPRNSDGEYTLYSFPSKTMEYMASGTPVLLCKLPTIPDEYYQYCFYINNNSPKEIADKIHEIFQRTPESLFALGYSARQFIMNNKTSEQQVKRICDFILKL